MQKLKCLSISTNPSQQDSHPILDINCLCQFPNKSLSKLTWNGTLTHNRRQDSTVLGGSITWAAKISSNAIEYIRKID